MFGTGIAIVQARVTNKTPFRRTSMSLNKASIAVALAAFLAVGGIAGQALALTQEKKAQYDAIMKEFADKTAPLRDKLAAKYIELRTLGNSPTPDPKAIGKATEELVALRNEFAKERSAMLDRVAKEIVINIFQQYIVASIHHITNGIVRLICADHFVLIEIPFHADIRRDSIIVVRRWHHSVLNKVVV